MKAPPSATRGVGPYPTIASLARRGALLVAIAVLWSPAGAPTSTAAPDGEAPPPRTPAPPTWRELEARRDDVEEAARAAARRVRYERLAAYLREQPAAPDAERARETAMDLAEELRDWERLVEDAEAFARAHPKGGRLLDALVLAARGRAELGRNDEARKAFERAAAAAVEQRTALTSSSIEAFSAYAEWCADVGDALGARSVLGRWKEAFRETIYATQVSRLADGRIADLDRLGKPPAAFPKGTVDGEGAPIALGDFKREVVIVVFWSTMGPSVSYVESIATDAVRLAARGVRLIDVSTDGSKDEARAKEVRDEQRFPGRHVRDADRSIEQAFGVEAVPYVLVLDRDGTVARAGRPRNGDLFTRTVERLLAAK